MTSKPTIQQLAAENRDLRARLEIAEADLSEIHSGEADALFVTGAGGAQLFTLKGADQSYRILIENMSEGALTLTPEGVILYANRRFAEMLRTPLEKVIGSEIRNWIASKSRQVLQALLRKNDVDNHREELALAAADGTQVPVYLSVSRLVLDEIDSVCMVVTDLTEQKRNAAILAAEKLSNAILEQAADAIVICDKAGRIMRASKQAQVFCGKSPLGQLFEQAIPLRQLDGTEFFSHGTIDTNRRSSAEARLEHDGQEFDLLVSVGHLKGARDELLGSVVTLTDITKRKQAELAIREEMTFTENLIQSLPDIFFLLDDQAGLLRWNNKLEELFGLSSEEMLKSNALEFIHDEDRSRVALKLQQAFESGSASVEARMNLTNGLRDYILTGKRIETKLGVSVIGIGLDITERKNMESKLRESDQEFHTLAEAMPQIVWITRADGWNIYFNQNWMDYTGMTLEESLGNGWNKPFHPDDQQRAWDAWEKAVTKNDIYSIESRLRRADGVYRWWLVRGVPLLDAEGNILKWFGTCTDIHDLKTAELEIARANQELRESERRFTDQLENVELISIMRDREERITYCNEYMLRLTGWRYEEVIGKNWVELFLPPEIVDEKKKFFAELLQGKAETRHHESEILTRSGEHRLIHWNNTLLRSATGEVIGTASIGEDITERKMAEDVLKQRAAELERFHRLSVGRELQMIELKKQINELALQTGQKPPYELAFLTQEPVRTNPDHEQSS